MNSSVFRRNEALSNTSTIVAGARDLVISRQPFSSTPAVTPLMSGQNHNSMEMDIKLQKASMKLPVGYCSEELINQSVVVTGGNKRPNVTIRDHGLSSSGLISPIILSPGVSGVRNNVQYTEPRGLTRQLSGGEDKYSWDCASSTVNSCGSTGSKSTFPYPKVLSQENDPGEMLCLALRTLNSYKRVDGEKSRLYGLKNRKEKEDKIVPYEFLKDTFTAVNSEAANHALHLIFSTLDLKETEQRFRDCWPVYEKKLEGVFRRVALDWIKQLVESNPDFFQDIRTEAIGGLLVNPGGDRFISFLRQLSRLALFTVANKIKGLIKQQVLMPPSPNSDPEIENRQMHLLEYRARKNAEAVFQKYHSLLKNEAAFLLRMRVIEENQQRVQRQNAMQSARLMSYVNNYPDLFENPSEAEIEERDAIISSLKLRDLVTGEDYNDILRNRLECVLKKRCEEIYKPVSLIQDLMEEFGTIWHILEMDKSTLPVLDCSKLPFQQSLDDSETPSLSLFVRNFLALAENFISNEYLNSETPIDLLQEFEGVSCRIKFLEIMKKEINNSGFKDSSITEHIEMQRSVLKLRMNDFDWSLLSRVHEDGINHLLDMTPLRVYDINRSSGWTPGINNFLDSSSSSSSGEHQQTSIVRRRNAHLMKGKARNNMPRSRSDSARDNFDTTDGLHDFNKSLNSHFSSTQIDATPLSSTQIQSSSNNVRGSSLFRDSITGTPTSAISVSSVTSSMPFKMKKSVSFGDTPTSTTAESSFSSVISVRHNQRRSNRFSSGARSSSTEQSSVLESPFGTGSRDVLSRLSFASSTSTPVGLDSSTQERLNKLMESVAANRSSRLSRSSLSPIPSSELEAADVSSDHTQTDDSPLLIQSTNETIRKQDGDKGENDLNRKYGTGTEPDSFADFSDVSIIEDLEGIKGIMETSYVEFFRNSDSDD